MHTVGCREGSSEQRTLRVLHLKEAGTVPFCSLQGRGGVCEGEEGSASD